MSSDNTSKNIWPFFLHRLTREVVGPDAELLDQDDVAVILCTSDRIPDIRLLIIQARKTVVRELVTNQDRVAEVRISKILNPAEPHGNRACHH